MEVSLWPRTLEIEIGDLLQNRSLNKCVPRRWQSFSPNSAKRRRSKNYCSNLKQNQTGVFGGMLLWCSLTNCQPCCLSLIVIAALRPAAQNKTRASMEPFKNGAGRDGEHRVLFRASLRLILEAGELAETGA